MLIHINSFVQKVNLSFNAKTINTK